MRIVMLIVAIFLITGVSVPATIPLMINYQGAIEFDGVPYDGVGHLKFALVSGGGASTEWSNDGTSINGSEPTAAVPINIPGGMLSVQLGDTALPNMQEIPTSAFDSPDVQLRIWFSDDNVSFEQLTPDRELTSVPFAYVASGLAPESITGPELARESVWPEHRGRNNTVVSYFGAITNSSLPFVIGTVPVGKTFIITDVALTDYELAASFFVKCNDGDEVTLMEIRLDSHGSNGYAIDGPYIVNLNSGIPVSSESQLIIQTDVGNIRWRATISGYEITN